MLNKYSLARTFDQDLGLYRDSQIIGTLVLPEAEARELVEKLNRVEEQK